MYYAEIMQYGPSVYAKRSLVVSFTSPLARDYFIDISRCLISTFNRLQPISGYPYTSLDLVVYSVRLPYVRKHGFIHVAKHSMLDVDSVHETMLIFDFAFPYFDSLYVRSSGLPFRDSCFLSLVSSLPCVSGCKLTNEDLALAVVSDFLCLSETDLEGC